MNHDLYFCIMNFSICLDIFLENKISFLNKNE